MEGFQHLVAESLSGAGFDFTGETGAVESMSNMMFPPVFPWGPFLMTFPPKFPLDTLANCPVDMDTLPQLQDSEWPFYAPPTVTLSPELTDSTPQVLKSRKVEVALGPVGTLSQAERKEKILRYLEKRSRRKYTKRISYQCRKRVADQRIRVKGRFVSSKQAERLRGLENEKNNVPWPWQAYI